MGCNSVQIFFNACQVADLQMALFLSIFLMIARCSSWSFCITYSKNLMSLPDGHR